MSAQKRRRDFRINLNIYFKTYPANRFWHIFIQTNDMTLHTSTTLVVTVPICKWTCSCVQNKVCTFRGGKLRNGEPKSTQLAYGGWVFVVRHFCNTVSFGCPGPNQMLAQGSTEGASWGRFYFINLVATTLVLGKTKEAGCCWLLAHAVKTVADPGYGIKRS
jgi:hypothetical protein